MLNNMKFWVTAILLFLIGSALSLYHGCREYGAGHAPRRYYGAVPEADTLLYRRCHQDTDCVYMGNGCCHCVTKMEELSVNKALKAAFEKRLSPLCAKGFACPDVGRVPDCGTGGNICKEGICTYMEPYWDSKTRQVFWEYPEGVRNYRDPVVPSR